MIHTANNFTAKHHRYLLQFVQVGLQTLPLPGDTGRKEDGTSKRIRRSLHASAGAPEPSTSAATQQTIFQSAPAQTPGEPSSHLLPHVAQQQPAMAQPLSHNLSMGNLIDSRPQESSPTGQLISPFSHSEQPPFDPTANGAFGLGPYMLGPGADQGDMTRASELLGVPSLGMGFTAKVPPHTQDPAEGEIVVKHTHGMLVPCSMWPYQPEWHLRDAGLIQYNMQDIDAAYLFGASGDLDADLSALLEVPDMTVPGSSLPGPSGLSALPGQLLPLLHQLSEGQTLSAEGSEGGAVATAA